MILDIFHRGLKVTLLLFGLHHEENQPGISAYKEKTKADCQNIIWCS